ncbi:alanine--tRNA ligase-related protein [Marinifilum flexuosum]|uniref:Alanine--tRNA ligase n=1 Tax=Marinifilum flexuosum TaxID=1117708 RepID=A0A419XB50_9BACT|nr:alanine--tRNA ligase-related protein [Marinifilum flexuosum]RKE04978.1 Ser-tRNA(Ala) deacylase AlaX [Marinifilum flexuosum]
MTKLNYLDDSYLLESSATVQKIITNEKGVAVILDQTIFYPQGGGQPTDIGSITFENNLFLVTSVRMDENGQVWHFGEFQQGEFQQEENVILKVDAKQRLLNTRLHSAGHLLDCAVLEMGLTNIKPTKGYHFPNGSYVEYNGVIDESASLIPGLEEKVNELVDKNLAIEKQMLSPEEAKQQGVWAPEGKSARIVNFFGFPYCGCGGTHINSSKEIGEITIRKIKSKKGITRISYCLK